MEDLAECEMDDEGRLGDDEQTQQIMLKEQARHAKLEEQFGFFLQPLSV